MRSAWIKHGILNTLEHAITRGSDAAASLVLLWALSPELFARLASSQALIAPALFLFIAPESVIYRDYAIWRKEGARALSDRVRALRLFALGKGQFAVVLSAILAFVPSSSSGSWLDHFWALLWAFALVLAPQLSGPDREFLRLDLKLKDLNAITIYQKLSLLAGTCAVALSLPSHIELLALVAVFSCVSTCVLAAIRVRVLLEHEGSRDAGARPGPSVIETLTDSMADFSIWQHGIGVIIGWVQTMDLFFLSLITLSARDVGLYSAVLKLANFSIMLPLALANLFSIWIGRRSADEAGLKHERQQLTRLSLVLFAGIVAQGLVLYELAPWILRLLSHGRWSEAEISAMRSWFGWILAGAGTFATTFLVSAWLPLRVSISRLFTRIYLPWVVASAAVYWTLVAWGDRFGGFGSTPGSTPMMRAAVGNIIVSGIFVLLLAGSFTRLLDTAPGEG